MYIHALATEPFVYKSIEYKPFSRLVLRPSVFSSYECPEKCGACCKPVTLTWKAEEYKNLLENVTEEQKKRLYSKTIEKALLINNKSLKFYVFEDFEGDFCYFLNKENGRCTIYKNRILPGRIELFKFAVFPKKNSVDARVSKPGRGWAYKTVEGKKGVKCRMNKPYVEEVVASYISALKEVSEIMDYFNIKNDVMEVINYLNSFETNKDIKPFIIRRKKNVGLLPLK